MGTYLSMNIINVFNDIYLLQWWWCCINGGGCYDNGSGDNGNDRVIFINL